MESNLSRVDSAAGNEAMSLETLLQAARYLEDGTPGCRSKARVSGRGATEFHHYAKTGPPPRLKGERTTITKMEQEEDDPDEEAEYKRRAGGSGTREIHNKLEKNRRAHLKECFDNLKMQIPNLDDVRKISNLSILRNALAHILKLKRRERDMEQHLENLRRENCMMQERLIILNKELKELNVDFDVTNYLRNVPTAVDSHSVSTATAAEEGGPILSDPDDEIIRVTAANSSGLASPLRSCLTSRTLSTALPTSNAAYRTNLTSAAQTTRDLAINNMKVTSSCPAAMTSLLSSTTLTAGSTSSVVTSIATSFPQSVKRSVTQLLQQTLAQKALLQQQQQQQQQHQLKHKQPQPQLVQLSQQPQPTQLFAVNASDLRPLMQAVKPLTQVRPAVALSSMIPSILAPGTSLITPAVTITATGPSSTTPAQVSAIATLSKLVNNSVVSTTAGNTPTVSILTPMMSSSASQSTSTTATTVTFSAMKQIIATPIQTAQLMSPGQMSALTQIIATPVSRANQQVITSNMTLSPIFSPTVAHMSGVQPTLSTIPGTQLMSPMTVLSPAMAGLSQTQLNSMVNSQVLKTLGQIPIIQQPFTLPIKPLVMVTVPSVVPATATATTAQPVQVTVPVSHAS